MFNKIKKQNGESFAKTIRNYHNGIFEIPGIVEIVKHAGTTAPDAEKILTYLVSLLSNKSDEKVKIEDPFVLLGRAGYDAFFADDAAKQDSIKKYFKEGEKLCTFGSDRFRSYFIVNAVKKDVDTILRADFVGKETREDLYGTSVISIQMSKSGGFISIKNRYNHSVPNCDNTFNSDPDKIIPGLSAALQAHFKVSFDNRAGLNDGFVLAGNKILKVNMEIEGISFGDTAYVKNGELIECLAANGEYLFDHFVFNAKTKLFTNLLESKDGFVPAFNDTYGGRASVYVKNHCIYDGETMLVGV